jgi:predicted NAD/FAD-dependent oxidoreductase
VIGGGMAGLICARTLLAYRLAVTVLDQGREPGGRISTRQVAGYRFDDGAQYFTVHDPRFQREVDAWLAEGLAAEWSGRVCVLESGTVSASEQKTRYVGVPEMSAITRHLAKTCHVLSETRVAHVHREGRRWRLRATAGEDLGAYDVVVVALPAPQAGALLGEVPGLAARVASVKIAGCWAVMLAFAQSLALPFDGALVQASALSWVARNNSKPGRGGAECWVLHGAPAWSDEHIDAAPEQVIAWLSEAFHRATLCQDVQPTFTAAHRWRYALPTVLLEEACLFDATLAIGACGDWCAGPRVEGAFLSGLALADYILSKGP